MPLIRVYIIIPGSPSLPYALLPGGSHHFAPPVFCYISFWPPLAKILKKKPWLLLKVWPLLKGGCYWNCGHYSGGAAIKGVVFNQVNTVHSIQCILRDSPNVSYLYPSQVIMVSDAIRGWPVVLTSLHHCCHSNKTVWQTSCSQRCSKQCCHMWAVLLTLTIVVYSYLTGNEKSFWYNC